MSQQPDPQWQEQSGPPTDYPAYEDHRRTTQRATYSRTSTWRDIFMMGGWRLILALVLLVFIFVVWALLTDKNSQNVDAQPAEVPAVDMTPLPTMTPVGGERLPQVRVSGTGTSGLFLRSAASRGASAIKTLPEGTVLEIIGDQTVDGTTTWLNVRDATGAEGWVAESYTTPIE